VPKTVTIITPSFNRADIISETAASIFGQTYPHWEWMIVDDGSTDNSWEVISEYAAKDSRVKIFKRDRQPKGACACRNIAVEKSSGDYLIFLDTDDLLASFCLEQRVKAMEENGDCDFVIFPMLLFKNKPDDLKMLWSIENSKDDLERILESDPICQGTGTLWKKESFRKIGMWREDLKLWQDIELHIRSILWPLKYAKRMDLLPDVFLRISDVSLSRTGFNSLPKIESRVNVFTYTLTTLQKKGLFKKYKKSLGYMGWDIIMSAINNSHFSIASRLIDFCKSHSLYSEPEINKLKNYQLIRRLKMYKIKPVHNYYLNKVKAMTFEPEYTIGKVPYQKAILV